MVNRSVRFPKSYWEKLDSVANALELESAEAHRLAAKAGLKALERLSPEELIAFIEKEIK